MNGSRYTVRYLVEVASKGQHLTLTKQRHTNNQQYRPLKTILELSFPLALTKAGIIKSIENQFGFPQNNSTNVVESFLETTKQSFENGEDVMISGFGKFCMNEKSARKGRDPQTGEHIIIEPRSVVTFRCSSRARDKTV